MKRKSHLGLGKKLSFEYFASASKCGRSAFLLGCMQPDWNPTTYLKGSRTYQWLRGHNYENARRCMERLAARLEGREKWGVISYYHNNWFDEDLSVHCEYENRLQEHFLSRLERPWTPRRELLVKSDTIAELIHRTHLRYESHGGDLITDSRYVFAVATEVLSLLFADPAARTA